VESLATPKPSERARLLHEGDRLAGRYLLTRYIAAGGMGEVLEARDERLNELVAVKTNRPDSASADALKRGPRWRLRVWRREGLARALAAPALR
jgi:hypothetical protein